MDKIHISKYSERPKTIAARKIPDDVPQAEKESRWRMLEDLQIKILDEKNQRWNGEVVEVLVEDHYKGKWRGRTPHGKLVFFEDHRDQRGKIVRVKIEWAGPFSLIGKAADAKRGIRELELVNA
jgi:tRNA-2-methylthio-N6-dimethylallyladenosine synthase